TRTSSQSSPTSGRAAMPVLDSLLPRPYPKGAGPSVLACSDRGPAPQRRTTLPPGGTGTSSWKRTTSVGGAAATGRRAKMSQKDGAGRMSPAWPKDALRISFGVIWLIDAILKWLPGFRSGYMDSIMGVAQGQPGWLKPWFDFWINLQHPRVTFFAYLVAVTETLIAVAVIVGV